ncbi:MAG: hypothetical protein V2I41_14130, partial [Pseudomonadales bacterium]|jgi:hypothetical protein|nr:hypothetical protein [Pseudomonadales bacterium]
LVVWISGVQPVLADKDYSPLNSAQIFQLSASSPAVPSLYPPVAEQAAAAQINSKQVWRLQTPVVQPRARHQDKYGLTHNALREVRPGRYQPIYKVIDVQRNPVAMRRAFDARKLTFSPHVKPVSYERKIRFRIGKRQ